MKKLIGKAKQKARKAKQNASWLLASKSQKKEAIAWSGDLFDSGLASGIIEETGTLNVSGDKQYRINKVAYDQFLATGGVLMA